MESLLGSGGAKDSWGVRKDARDDTCTAATAEQSRSATAMQFSAREQMHEVGMYEHKSRCGFIAANPRGEMQHHDGVTGKLVPAAPSL